MTFNCLECGGCCLSADRDFVYVFVREDEDAPIIEAGREELLEYDGYEIWLRTKEFGEYRACMALEGELGKDCRCSIYEARPGVCRRFEAGGPACLLARSNLELPLTPTE